MTTKRDDFAIDDFEACARTASMKRGSARQMLDDVRAAVGRWPDFADDAGVDEAQAARITRTHRLKLPPA